MRSECPLLVPGELTLVVLCRINHLDKLAHLRNDLVVERGARVHGCLGFLEQSGNLLILSPCLGSKLKDRVQVFAVRVHDVYQ